MRCVQFQTAVFGVFQSAGSRTAPLIPGDRVPQGPGRERHRQLLRRLDIVPWPHFLMFQGITKLSGVADLLAVSPSPPCRSADRRAASASCPPPTDATSAPIPAARLRLPSAALSKTLTTPFHNRHTEYFPSCFLLIIARVFRSLVNGCSCAVCSFRLGFSAFSHQQAPGQPL